LISLINSFEKFLKSLSITHVSHQLMGGDNLSGRVPPSQLEGWVVHPRPRGDSP